MGQKTTEGGELPHGSQKRQRSPGGTPGGGHSKRPKQTEQLSYTRPAQEGVRVAIVCEGCTGDYISRDNFVDLQRAIGRLVDVLPEEDVTQRLFDSYWAKGRPLWFTRIRTPRSGWRVRLWRHGSGPGSNLWAWMLLPYTREWRPGFRAPWRTRRGFSCGSVD